MLDNTQSSSRDVAVDGKSKPGNGGAAPDAGQSQLQPAYGQVRSNGPCSGKVAGRYLLHAEAGKDNYLTGSDADDEIHGGELDDVILGQSGDDVLFGHGGNDLLLGGEGDDMLFGGEGDDTLDSGNGASTLNGESGNDILIGGPTTDNLIGGPGQDILIGGPGSDSLTGEQGDDIYRFSKGDGHDVIWNAGDAPFSSLAENYLDRIEYGSDIHQDQLWFQGGRHDLLVTNIETGDSQRIKQWYDGEANRIDEFSLADGTSLRSDRVEALVQGMASMVMPAVGTHHLPPAYQAALNPVIAQSWQ